MSVKRRNPNELLEDEVHEVTDEINAIAGTQRGEQLGEVRLVEGHRVVSFGGFG